MQLIKILLFVLPSLFTTNIVANEITKNEVLVCYGRLEPELIKGYSYVILESHYFSVYEIQKIKSQNEKVIAYISFGEINANSQYFNMLKDNAFGKNEIWNSYYLNLKLEKTIEILKEMVKNTLDIGFDGLFLDNIDNFSSYGPQSQQKDEMISLLKMIREEYPTHILIQNSGIPLIDETAPFVNAVVMESVATNYTFDDKNYKLRNKIEFDDFVKKLRLIRKKHKLPIILIEYADTSELYNAIIKRIKPYRFYYFIGNIDLQTIPLFKN